MQVSSCKNQKNIKIDFAFKTQSYKVLTGYNIKTTK